MIICVWQDMISLHFVYYLLFYLKFIWYLLFYID